MQFINNLNFGVSKCYINKGSITPTQAGLHIHILNEEDYKSTFAKLEQGNRLNSMVSVTFIINMLILNHEYYNKFKVESIIHQIH